MKNAARIITTCAPSVVGFWLRLDQKSAMLRKNNLLESFA
jgi:hypothetical protein